MSTATTLTQKGHAGTESRALTLAFALLALLAALSYANSLHNDFAFDDRRVILKNPILRHFDQIPALFTMGGWMPNDTGTLKGRVFRPLVLSSFAINYEVAGYDPFSYRLSNVGLHILVTWALLCLARRLGFSLGAALVAASLFAVHPLHTEAVTNVVGRAELMMSLGVLMALIWYIDAGAPLRLGPRYGCASLIAFTMALLSKEQAMMLPALLLLYDLCSWDQRTPLSYRIRKGLYRYMWYLLALGAYLVIVHTVVYTGMKASSGPPFLDNPLASQEWPYRLFTALAVSGKYLGLFFWPQHLSADYSYNAIPLATQLGEMRVLVSLLAWCSLLGLALWSYFRGSRKVVFSIGLTFLTFLPTSNFLISIGTIMGERLFYLPSAGLCLLGGVGWDWLGARFPLHRRPLVRGVAIGFFAVLLLLSSLRTFLRNEDWENNESLFLSAKRVAPDSAKVYAGLAGVQLKKKEWQQALENYHKAVQIYPDYPLYYPRFTLNLGSTLLGLGQVSEAIAYLEKAVSLRPNSPTAQYNLGFAYLQQGSWRQSEKVLSTAIRLKPDLLIAHVALSRSLREQGRFREALKAANKAAELRPDSILAHTEQAVSLKALDRVNRLRKN